MHRVRSLRPVFALLVLLLASNPAWWPSLQAQSCAGRCPSDCPMHSQKLRCHEGSGETCHKRQVGGLQWRVPGCSDRSGVWPAQDEPAILMALLPTPTSTASWLLPARPMQAPERALATPFRPPPFRFASAALCERRSSSMAGACFGESKWDTAGRV